MRILFQGLLATLVVVSVQAVIASDSPKIVGASAIVINAETGAVLHQKAADVRRPVASTQKLLTALLVVEHGNLDTKVVIQPEDTDVEPSKLGFRAGAVYTRRQLLEGLLVKSGNDAALALARDNAGSIPAFCEKMNRRAWSLGALNSRFLNPNGLPNDAQYSSARDMSMVAKAAYRNPVIREIVALKSIDFQYAPGFKRTFRNTNRVLQNWEVCNGMKTGYTRASGHCLVASAHWRNQDVISVVLGSNGQSVWNDSSSLLHWAFVNPK